jgi:SWI/SNF-related matrix-associated actin-dependent regulator 1 of chromatin subfamily A
MRQIEFPDRYTIKMNKAIWSEQELSLAACYSFKVSAEENFTSVICNIKRTSRQSVENFISLAFQALVQSPLRENERKTTFAHIDKMYLDMITARDGIMSDRLKYWSMLREYQKESVMLMTGRKHNLLSLQQGMGKSITAATVSRALKIRRTLIICIPVAKWNWQDDLCTKFGYNQLYFSILDSKKSKTIKALSPYHERFVITHYDAIPKHMDYILSAPIDHIIIDESQFIKNTNTARYKLISRIVEANPQAKISFLSGTPIKNRVDDLFAYFKLAGHELGKNRAKFIREYAKTGQGRNLDKVVGARNMDQLSMNMANFMIRKTKKDCPEIPDKTYMKVVMELGDYREEYDRIMLELLQSKDRGAINGHIISMNRIFAMAKVKPATEMIEDLIDKGEKVVVFTSYKDPIRELEAYFGDRCVKVDGDVDHSERFVRVKKFVNDPKCMVFLGNMIAAGTSLNLTVSSEVIFLNYPFTATEIDQAVDRTHRIGQENKVNVYFLTCKDTIDENIYNLVASKQGEINQIIDGGDGLDYGSDVKEKLYQMFTNQPAICQ